MWYIKWGATVAGLIGLHLAARRPLGWLLCALASLLWLLYAIHIGELSLIISTGSWLLVESNNFRRVKREPK